VCNSKQHKARDKAGPQRQQRLVSRYRRRPAWRHTNPLADGPAWRCATDFSGQNISTCTLKKGEFKDDEKENAC
jgi:hypothetical protein